MMKQLCTMILAASARVEFEGFGEEQKAILRKCENLTKEKLGFPRNHRIPDLQRLHLRYALRLL